MLVTRRGWSLAVVLAAAAVPGWGSVASAAGPTKQECVAANEDAQDLRHTGKLLEARRQFAACTAATCPAAVREDCAQRLREVEAALPSILFVVKDRAGHDLSSVHVTMDGDAFLEKLDGTGVPINPGEHKFGFKADGYRSATSTVVVREGDSDRPLRIILESTAAPPPKVEAPAPTPEAPLAPREASPLRPLGITLGVIGLAGVAAGSVFGLVAKSTYDRAWSECSTGKLAECPTQAAQATDDLNSAKSQALLSTIAFVAGGALVATGAVMLFLAPKAQGMVTVGAAVTPGGGSLSLSGSF